MKISIVMASYNYEDYIKEAIESVRMQTYLDWELIIVDDGSSDNSHQVIQSYCNQDDRIQLYTHKKNQNKGLVQTVQLEVSKASAEYLAFLESDERWFKNCLPERVKILKQYPQLSFLFNEIKAFGDSESVKEILKYQKERNAIFEQWTWPTSVALPFFLMNVVPTFSCVTIKKSVLNECDFNTPVAPWLNWWLYFQIALKNEFYFFDVVLTEFRRHPRCDIVQSSNNIRSQENFFLKLYCRCLSSRPLVPLKK
jgi:glycosyltransferase involved in cell wall biosynthesis